MLEKTAKLTREERIAIQRDTVARHMVGECTNDWDTVKGTFISGPRTYYEIVPGGIHFQSDKSVHDFYDVLAAVLPDLNLKVSHEYDVEGYAIREMKVTGTHSAEFLGIPATGKHISFEVCAIYIFDDEEPEKLLAERAYWDNDSILKQLRGEVAPTLDLVERPRR